MVQPDRPICAERAVGVRYRDILQLERLLSCQPEQGTHDELMFVVVHQVHELWFKLMLSEMEKVRDLLLADQLDAVEHLLRRVVAIVNVLISQWAVLDTMLPADFTAFRNTLQGGSGFESVQYREIEFLVGLTDKSYLDRVQLTDTERRNLVRRLEEPGVRESFVGVVQRRGVESLAALWRDGYQELSAANWPLLRVAETLLDVDQAFVRWRMHHALTVERQIGAKPGTGGSSGVEYLRARTATRFFPELWEVRSQV